MSAWYILAASVEITLDRRYADADKFIITVEGNGRDACYIQSAMLNGKPYNRCYIDHEDIIRGGKLHFVLGSTPNKQWGVE